jgi:ABC-type antimicrobial peptide transport system permease subunit
MILREGGMLVASGLTLGIIGAYVLAGVIRGLLFGVHPHDPMTFICVTVLMTSIAMLSCWIPALRAARIDPAVSLRA